MNPKELVEEIMPVILSGQVKWLILQPIFFLTYFLLWILGVYEYDILLKHNWQWWILSRIIYIMFLYTFYSGYILIYKWEDDMNDLFWRTSIFIIFGIFIWCLISFQAAY